MGLFRRRRRKKKKSTAIPNTYLFPPDGDSKQFVTPKTSPPIRAETETVIVNSSNEVQRHLLKPETINAAQTKWASQKYVSRIHSKYFSDYPEKPFISKDRELFTNWESQVALFPHMILPKKNMIRFKDGLLPGHIYMLYWIHKIHRKQIPVYFEYEYGICFEEEVNFLINHGYLNEDKALTDQGFKAIKKHSNVIRQKSPSADLSFLENIEDL